MQKGVFNTWLKELCALVFVQTIQAFILAIVLSIILVFIAPVNGKFTSQDSVSALGVLCIVLLSSLTKMEQITKKIFGLDSGLLQNGPHRGLLSSLVALKALGRVFNNVPKMIGGIGSATFGQALDKKKARSSMLNKLNRRGLNQNGDPIGGGGPGLGAGDDAQGREESDNQLERNRDIASQQFGNNSAGSIASGYNSKDKENFHKIMDQYDDELAKAREKQRKGFETAAAGLAETIGAGVGGLGGFAGGAMTGLAQGDVDQMFKSAAVGMGVGDAAGEHLTSAISTVTNTLNSRAKTNRNLNKQLAQMEANLKINNQHRGTQAKRVKNITEKIRSDLDNL